MNNALEAYTKIKLDDEVVHIDDAVIGHGGYSQPFSLGYSGLDDALLGGVRCGDLVVITGKPGAGKTTLAQNFSANLSKQMFSSLWFSYEVVLNDLANKFKEMGAPDTSFLVYVPKKNTTGNLSWVKNKIKEGLEKFNTKFVFIDDLDALSPTNTRGMDNKRLILTEICQELKNIAIELEIVIFFMAHVRKIEAGKDIDLDDLAETSGIGQKVNFAFSISRVTERRNVGGQMEEIEENRSIIKILKNRLTGQKIKIQVVMENNTFVPL